MKSENDHFLHAQFCYEIRSHSVESDSMHVDAERIPDDVPDYIRKNSGTLRLKIRLKDDGVLIGWDVEKIAPFDQWRSGLGLHSGVSYLRSGSDFRDARPSYGGVPDPGWQK